MPRREVREGGGAGIGGSGRSKTAKNGGFGPFQPKKYTLGPVSAEKVYSPGGPNRQNGGFWTVSAEKVYSRTPFPSQTAWKRFRLLCFWMSSGNPHIDCQSARHARRGSRHVRSQPAGALLPETHLFCAPCETRRNRRTRLSRQSRKPARSCARRGARAKTRGMRFCRMNETLPLHMRPFARGRRDQGLEAGSHAISTSGLHWNPFCQIPNSGVLTHPRPRRKNRISRGSDSSTRFSDQNDPQKTDPARRQRTRARDARERAPRDAPEGVRNPIPRGSETRFRGGPKPDSEGVENDRFGGPAKTRISIGKDSSRNFPKFAVLAVLAKR